MAKPKMNYKVFNTATNKYVSNGYRSKSTWQSVVWAMAAAEKIAKRHGAENIEIHLFPIESATRVSLSAMRLRLKEEAAKKAEKKRSKVENEKKRALLVEFHQQRNRLLEITEKLKEVGVAFE